MLPVDLHRPLRRDGARHGAQWGALVVVLALASPSCKRIAEDRARSAAARQAVSAIESYSAASLAANEAHRAVVVEFAAANRSTNLADYRRSLRERVLPAMDGFVQRLRAMPAATPDLATVHARLVTAYDKARRDIATFEAELMSPADLPRFDRIRTDLQEAVKAYQQGLRTYYASHDRQLASDRAAGADATPVPVPATATPTAPTPVGPTSHSAPATAT
ncbi:MAG: hypothetical protein EXR79_04015 [Myxococcales bacterium]|nr:hypothetical protein [Myxococcales bacterium]